MPAVCAVCAVETLDCMLYAEYEKDGDNKWEIDDGMRALKRLPELILMLRPYEEPRDLDVPGVAAPVHSGDFPVIAFSTQIHASIRSLLPG